LRIAATALEKLAPYVAVPESPMAQMRVDPGAVEKVSRHQ